MSVEYRWALHHAHHDPDVRVVVLTGAGDAFCVGADAGALGAIGDANGSYTKEANPLPPYPAGTPAGLRHNHTAPLAVATPVIAAINGGCAGAGFVLATYADIRWASERARIATSFAGLGLPAEYGIGWMLPRIMGTARALEMLYDPAARTADEARRLGFVQRVVPDGQLLPEVLAYARRLARHSAGDSLRMMKRAVLVGAAGELDAAYRTSVADMDAALTGHEFRTGLRALRDKTAPDFLARQRADDGTALSD
jgi:enoyl-CoA hydratase/carnithine racemase